MRSETNSAVLAAHIKSVEITIMTVSSHPLCPSLHCQRQQGPRPPGSMSVSLLHMAQAACFFTFSPPCHTLVKSLDLSLLRCVTVSCCHPLPDRWSVYRSPLLTHARTFGFVTQACTTDRCRKQRVAVFQRYACQ